MFAHFLKILNTKGILTNTSLKDLEEDLEVSPTGVHVFFLIVFQNLMARVKLFSKMKNSLGISFQSIILDINKEKEL